MLTCKHGRFTLPPAITYLNCAYMAPLLKTVEQAGIRGVRRKRNPTTVSPPDFFHETELLRDAFAQLIHTNDPKRVAIIPAASYGLANVAHNLRLERHQHILVAGEQFPSNVYPWQKVAALQGAAVKTVLAPEGPARGQRWNEHILDQINTDTKAVAVGHVHWADGTRFDLEAIRRRTREVGALLIIDGTQSVGALPFDVERIQPDALVCAGYKWLLGPYSIGLAYYGPAFDDGEPFEQNWINRLHSEDFSKPVHYEPEYRPGASRYDVGERSNFILVPMLIKAIEQINRWGVANIQAYCEHITRDAMTRLQERGFQVEDPAYRGHHLMGVRLPAGYDLEKIKANLVRKKIYVSFRGNAIRIAPHVYNRVEDLERLVKALSL